MTIEIINNAESVTAVMCGSLDTIAAEMLESKVQELESLAKKPITLDCTSLEYISSSGLRLLLRLRKAFAANGQKVAMTGVNDNIMEVLKITHFDKMFELS